MKTEGFQHTICKKFRMLKHLMKDVNVFACVDCCRFCACGALPPYGNYDYDYWFMLMYFFFLICLIFGMEVLF